MARKIKGGGTAVQDAEALRARKTTWKHDILMNWRFYLLFAPVFVYFIIFNYVPMGGIVMAFQDYRPAKGIFGSEWIGFENFIEFFTMPNFWRLMRNTFVISFLGLAIGTPVSIIFALLLNEIHMRWFKKSVQTISYLPYFVSMVVIAGLVIEFVSSNGIITNILVNWFGFERTNLLMNPKYFWTINLLSDIWQGMGYGSIIYISAISGVNQELYESAALDGTNRLQRVWEVTVPCIVPTIVTMLVLRCGTLMAVGHDKILLLYNSSIYETADVIATYINREAFGGGQQYGYSAAVGLFNSVIGTTLLLVSNFISSKLSDTKVI